MPLPDITPADAEEIINALAAAADGAGLVYADSAPSRSAAGGVPWTAAQAIAYATHPAATVTWTDDPHEYDLQVTGTDGRTLRFDARHPGRTARGKAAPPVKMSLLGLKCW